MAQLQARAGLPLGDEEWISDSMVLRQDREKGCSEVLVVIVRKTTVVPYLEIFERAQIEPEGFVLSSFALAEFARRAAGGPLSTYAHLDFAGEWMTVDLFLENQLIYSRSIPFAGERFDPGRIIEETRYCLASAQQTPMPEIVLTGVSEALEADLAGRLEGELGVSATFLSPEREDPQSVPPSVLGTATVDPRWSLVLLPPEQVEKKWRRKKRRDAAGAALWALAWMALIFGIGGLRVFQKERRLAEVEDERRRLEPRIEEMMDEGADPLEVLRELELRTPAGVALRTVSCEPVGRCSIQGSAPTLSTAMEFVDRLQKSTAFSQIALISSTLSSGGPAEHIDFQIQGVSKTGRGGGRPRYRPVSPAETSRTAEEGMSTFLKEIEKMAKKSSVRIMNVRPLPIERKGPHQISTVEVHSDASLRALTHFLYDLENSRLQLRVAHFTVAMGESSDRLKMDLALQGTSR